MQAQKRLEMAAVNVIRILKDISEFREARIAVIGGLALWKYNPAGRTTNDVDFIVSIDSAPQGVKQKLLALPNSFFTQQAEFFLYKSPDGSNIQIDITPEWQSPYMPSAAEKLKDIPDGTVPYISPIDLIIFKINSCGLRAQLTKRVTDASDAETLLEMETSRSPLSLTATQQATVEACIADVVTHGSMTEEWWRERLGLPAR
ncbi:hypothetical protein EV356DRAFT_580299 [Viridothelium virens]|uniref:Uncharacterized protein n=1 Tax=Viridothelium virens TaxID=1048519 RepID=A0A6A6GWE8_VIRVR|nr:hypothetical protein EV356DRAFT_580299 [Viridothelium virens]